MKIGARKALEVQRFAYRLLDWNGGSSSGVYSIGSCFLAASERQELPGVDLSESFERARRELLDGIDKKVNFPEAVTERDIREQAKLLGELLIWKDRHHEYLKKWRDT